THRRQVNRDRCRTQHISSSTGSAMNTGRHGAGRCWRSTMCRWRSANGNSSRCWDPPAAARAPSSIGWAVFRRSSRARSGSRGEPSAGRVPAHLAALAQNRHLCYSRCAGGGVSRGADRGHVGAPRPYQGNRRGAVQPRQSRIVAQPTICRDGGSRLEPGARRGDPRGAERRRMTSEPVRVTSGTGIANRIPAVVPRYLPLLLLALGWDALTRTGLVPTSALPPLDTVARAWYELASSGDLWTNGVASMTRGAAGLGLAIAGGSL